MNESETEIIKGKLKTAVQIWFGFIVSILFYAGAVEWLQRSNAGAVATTQNKTLHLFLLGAAALSFIAAGVSKSLILKIPAEKQVWDVGILADRLVRASLVSLALSESICLIGFGEYFVLRNYDSFYLFFIVGLLSMIMHMPRYPQWKSYLEQMTGMSLPME